MYKKRLEEPSQPLNISLWQEEYFKNFLEILLKSIKSIDAMHQITKDTKSLVR